MKSVGGTWLTFWGSLAGISGALELVALYRGLAYERLDIVSVLAAFYPAATVILARVLLAERISVRQWRGILVGLLALGLLSI